MTIDQADKMNASVRILREWAQREPAVRRIFIFGSRARTDFNSTSDLDVAVEVDGVHGNAQSTWMFDAPAWRSDLESRLPYSLDFQQLDGEATPVVAAAVASSSKLVYERRDLMFTTDSDGHIRPR